MSKKKRLVVGNWKLNPGSPEEARRILSGIKRTVRTLKKTAVAVCPPFPYLGLLARRSSAAPLLFFGAQDVFWRNGGAFTGEVSPEMVKGVGGRYVLIGHSERRALGESDELVARKVAAAVREELHVILCIGEPVRDASGSFFSFLRDELHASLSKFQRRYLPYLSIAYEPIWAIGKSFLDAMQPRDVHETSLFIQKVLVDLYGVDAATSIPVLYGGSVSSENAGPIVADGHVDGLLVGRESLNVEGFSTLLRLIDAV